jgi:hypothetical protein
MTRRLDANVSKLSPPNHEVFCVLGGRIDGDKPFDGSNKGFIRTDVNQHHAKPADRPKRQAGT